MAMSLQSGCCVDLVAMRLTLMTVGMGKTVSYQAKEGISRERLAWFKAETFSHRCLRKVSSAHPVITGLGSAVGIADRVTFALLHLKG
jgi:hypothetical protein